MLMYRYVVRSSRYLVHVCFFVRLALEWLVGWLGSCTLWVGAGCAIWDRIPMYIYAYASNGGCIPGHSGTSQACVRYGTGILGTGINVVPNLPKCPVPVLMLYRNYRSGIKVCSGTGGTGIDVPKLPKCPVPVLMYRTYRRVPYRNWCTEVTEQSVWYQYLGRTELTEVPGTGIDAVPNLPKCSVRCFRQGWLRCAVLCSRYCCSYSTTTYIVHTRKRRKEKVKNKKRTSRTQKKTNTLRNVPNKEYFRRQLMIEKSWEMREYTEGVLQSR